MRVTRVQAFNDINRRVHAADKSIINFIMNVSFDQNYVIACRAIKHISNRGEKEKQGEKEKR